MAWSFTFLEQSPDQMTTTTLCGVLQQLNITQTVPGVTANRIHAIHEDHCCLSTSYASINIILQNRNHGLERSMVSPQCGPGAARREAESCHRHPPTAK